MYIENSFSGKNWKLAEFDERRSLLIAQRYNLNELISKLIIIRKIDIENLSLFLKPDIKKLLPDPYILRDMEKSVKRIFQSIINKEIIGIISDYDVDGSTSAALIIKFFKSINIRFSLEIPDRINEGYGPNERIVNNFKKKGIKLIISLDCGTSSYDIFNKKLLGDIDVIVIDHHIGEIKTPYVYGLINPNRYDEDNNLKNLAAVGVVFLMLVALRRELRDKNYYKIKKLNEQNLTSYLDLVALGTTCDVVSLTNLNRAYVNKGLEVMKKRENIGLSSLIDMSNIRHSPNAYDLSYILGPRLNAASRIGDALLSSKILSSNDINETEIISKKLNLLNEKRKIIEQNILEEAREQAYRQNNKKIIIVHSHNWHPGVLGIVASRMVEEFMKPVIVISKNDKIGVASGRSLSSINLGSLIITAKEEGIILKGGGHKFAVGFKIENINIDKLSDFFEKNIVINKEFKFNSIITYDAIISAEQLNEDLLSNLEILEPYGNGNNEPKFLIKDLNLNFINIIKDRHLSMTLNNKLGNSIKAISFNVVNTILGEHLLNSKNRTLDILATLKRNYFSNKNVIQVIVNDAAYS